MLGFYRILKEASQLCTRYFHEWNL